jgi:hypothetical protein
MVAIESFGLWRIIGTVALARGYVARVCAVSAVLKSVGPHVHYPLSLQNNVMHNVLHRT